MKRLVLVAAEIIAVVVLRAPDTAHAVAVRGSA